MRTEGDYVDQLIAALHHPELQTPRRATWILGELRTPRAVDSLLHVSGTTAVRRSRS